MLSMPVAVADRTSAELSAAQQACGGADDVPLQGGCVVTLPDSVMMLAGSLGTGRTDSQTNGPDGHNVLRVVALAQVCTTVLWHLLSLSRTCCGTCSFCSALQAGACHWLSNREPKGAKCSMGNACPTPCTCSCAWDVAVIWELGNLRQHALLLGDVLDLHQDSCIRF